MLYSKFQWVKVVSISRNYLGKPCGQKLHFCGQKKMQHSSYAHHHRTQSQPAKLFRNGELLVHRDFSGQIPLCFYATGLESGGSHDYECFDERDILWARRVRFHINRVRYS